MFGADISIVGDRFVSVVDAEGEDTEQLRLYPPLGAVPWME